MYLKQKKKKKFIFYSAGPHCFYFFIHFIKSGHSFTLILTLSLSFISHSSQAPLSQHRHHRQAHSGTVQLASFFFFFSFFFILSNPVSFTLSHSLSSLIPSLSSSLSQRRQSDHCQRRRPGLTLSTLIIDPRNSSPIEVRDWETHGARR